jgi:aryl-alcohol dehydrogenase-like predicted oxidoreductase
MPLLQGILTGRWKSIEEMPQLRRRTRHFACTREGTRHGEPGCETLLMDTLAKLEETAAGIGQPLATVALAWAMARPGVTSVIVGARNPRQLLRNVAAVELDLDTQTMDRLDAITEPLKHQLGTNADMWLGEKDSRIR